MFCSKCGTNNADNAANCANCGASLTPGQPTPPPPPQYGQPGQPMYQQGAAPNIPNYLVWSILVTVCCCLIGGIIAIVYSSQVNTKLAQGDVAGAQQSSNSAKTWCIVSAIVGFVVNAIWIVVTVIGAMAGKS